MRREFALIHISDLHITGSLKNPTDQALEVLLAGLKSALMTLSQGEHPFYRPTIQPDCPRILVVSGDLVEGADEQAIEIAFDFINKLKVELDVKETLVIPGNHDLKRYFGMFSKKEAFNIKFGLSSKDLNGVFLREQGLHLMGLDSTPASLAQGKILDEEYNKLILQAYKSENIPRDEKEGLYRIVAVHHHPLPLAPGEGQKVLGVSDEDFMYFRAPATFLKTCLDINVALILHGHRHVTGLTRYSVPSTNTVNGYSDAMWKNIYVLSCPSSTGKDCDAGFNIITSSPNGATLNVFRYYRESNKGVFKYLDYNFPYKNIPLEYGGKFIRDIAIDVANQLATEGKSIDENRLLSLAEQLFRRRAFYSEREESWQHFLYVIFRTRLTWEQHVIPNMSNKLKTQGNKVLDVLYRLENFVTIEVLDVDGGLLDDLRMKYIDDKETFINRSPRTPRKVFQDEDIYLDKKSTILQSLSSALDNCKIDLPNLGKSPDSNVGREF